MTQPHNLINKAIDQLIAERHNELITATLDLFKDSEFSQHVSQCSEDSNVVCPKHVLGNGLIAIIQRRL